MSKSYVATGVNDNGKIQLSVLEIENGSVSGQTFSCLCDSYQMQGSTVVVDVGHYNSLEVYDCATGSHITSLRKF